MNDCTILLEESTFPLLITYIFKNIVKICPKYVSEFPVSKSKMGQNHFTLMTHHTQTVVSCNGTVCISLGISADQYLLF